MTRKPQSGIVGDAKATSPPARATIPMPAPMPWPMVVALGVTCLAAGLVTNLVFSLLGLVLFVLGLANWFGTLIAGTGFIEEQLAAPAERPAPVRPVAAGVMELKPGMSGHRMRIPVELHPYSAGAWGGLFGGLAMAVVALAYGLSSGRGPWYPVNMLAAVVVPGFQLESLPEMEKFAPLALGIALVIHLFLSLSLGLIYGMLLPMLPRYPVLWGGIIAPLLWTGLLHGSMGVLNPVMGTLVDWPWFIASQVAFGVAAGAIIVRSEKVYSSQLWGGASTASEGEP